MSFSENLKRVRKGRGLSQEELAELLDVSRQAVSKWEQGDGYPEAEKLVLLSRRLSVSLDELLDTGFERGEGGGPDRASGEIVITSPNENVILKCTKVASSQEFRTGRHSPKYALFGVGSASALGENSTFLAWYADRESISQELAGIQAAMNNGAASYELRFSVKTQRHWGSVRMLQ